MYKIKISQNAKDANNFHRHGLVPVEQSMQTIKLSLKLLHFLFFFIIKSAKKELSKEKLPMI